MLQPEEVTTPPEEVKPTVEDERMIELQDANRKLAETNERILKESRSHADKWRGYRDEMSAKETEKLTEEKNWKALMEKEKGEKVLLTERMEQMKRRTLKKTLDFEVARYASDANDVTDIINSLPSEMIQIDENTMQIDGVSDAVNELRQKKPYLFKKPTTPETVSAKPGYVTNAPERGLDDLKIEDKLDLFKQALLEKEGG